jgi:hypothetical protein
MKHKTDSYKEITNLGFQNQSFESYFSDYFMSKNNPVAINKQSSEIPFVVEWQMENDKLDFSFK